MTQVNFAKAKIREYRTRPRPIEPEQQQRWTEWRPVVEYKFDSFGITINEKYYSYQTHEVLVREIEQFVEVGRER